MIKVKVKVKTKEGKYVEVYKEEVPMLEKLGKLFKEHKAKPQTKEKKTPVQTKEKKEEPKEDPVNKKPPLSTARNLKNVKSGD